MQSFFSIFIVTSTYQPEMNYAYPSGYLVSLISKKLKRSLLSVVRLQIGAAIRTDINSVCLSYNKSK